MLITNILNPMKKTRNLIILKKPDFHQRSITEIITLFKLKYNGVK